MKKVLTILFASALIYSCGSNEGEKKADDQTKADTAAATPTPGNDQAASNEKALELIGSSDCMTCHAIDRKIIGPAYIDVAKKYESSDAVIDTLVAKIKNGGMGNWGNIPMTPHPALADADAREMVKYILSLKNQQ